MFRKIAIIWPLIWLLSLQGVLILIAPSLGRCAPLPLNSHKNSHSSQTLEKPPIILGEGEQRLLKIPSLAKYSLGNSVVRVHPFAQQDALLLKGATVGTGDLWVWKKDGTTEYRSLRVEKRTQPSARATGGLVGLERALSKLESTEIIFMGEGVVLRGPVDELSEASRVYALVRNFPKQVRNETELTDELLNLGQSRLRSWLNETGYEKSLRLERVGQTLWIRGHLPTTKELNSIEKQLTALFAPVSTDIDALPDSSQTIYFRVFLLELRRSQFHSIGVSWPGTTPLSFGVTPTGVADLFQLDFKIHQLEGNGNARILSNPELVVRAPGEAELFAGGEVPIQMQSQYYSNVSWKKYGLTLKLNVTHAAGSKIRLEVFTEVSHLDNHLSQNQIPGIQANRMKTQVDATLGVPLFLSGLLQQGMREEARGLPFLRKIPVLGRLFGSEDYLNEQSELVAILYPHSNPPPADLHRMKTLLPRGPIPPPRNWVSEEDELTLKKAQNYPWNVFE